MNTLGCCYHYTMDSKKKTERITLVINSAIRMALDSLPPTGIRGSEKWYLQKALAEGIAALAAHHEAGGEIASQFRLQVIFGDCREFDLAAEAEKSAAAIESVLKEAMKS